MPILKLKCLLYLMYFEVQIYDGDENIINKSIFKYSTNIKYSLTLFLLVFY